MVIAGSRHGRRFSSSNIAYAKFFVLIVAKHVIFCACVLAETRRYICCLTRHPEVEKDVTV